MLSSNTSPQTFEFYGTEYTHTRIWAMHRKAISVETNASVPTTLRIDPRAIISPTHARAPHTCRPTHQVPKTPSPAGHFQARGEETTRSVNLVLHTVDTRSSRCSDENMTTRASEWCRLSFLTKRNASHRRTSRLASEQKPTSASSDGFLFLLLSSFSFSSLRLKNGTCRGIFSLFFSHS